MLGILAVVAAAAATEEVCDPAATATRLRAAPLLPPCCEETDLASPEELAAPDEQSLLDDGCLARCERPPRAEDVCLAVRKRWWRAARALLQKLEVKERDRVRQFLMATKTGAGSVVQDLVMRDPDSVSRITPAVQWAQGRTTVRVLVRFSPKRHGPVSVPFVEEPELALNASTLVFSGSGFPHGRKPIRFELALPLSRPIDATASTHSFASAGRLTLVLAKGTNGTWGALCAEAGAGERRGPVTSWWEMQESIGEHGMPCHGIA
jgi:hypothetical protein